MSRKVRDIFYTGKGTFVNQFISGYTGAYPPLWNTLDCSHEEIWEADEVFGCFNQIERQLKFDGAGVVSRRAPNNYLGRCWTSTMRDDANGTVVRPASQVLKTPDNWCYVEYEVPERDDLSIEQERDWIFSIFDASYISRGTYGDGLAYMQHEVDHNLGYAKHDLMKFAPVLRHLISDPKRNICSEFCHNAKVCFGLLPGPFKVVSPRESWLMSMRIHHKPTIHLGSGEVVHDGYEWVNKKILKGA
jgi:hypothetical protein